MQLGVRIAVHAHVVDGREPAVIERLPDAQPLEQRLRAGRQRIHARIEREIGRPRRDRLREQRGLVAGLGQRERGRLADEPAADHGDVEGMVDSHGGHYSRGAKPLRGRTLREISGIAARGGATGRRMWAVAAARARRLGA